MSPQVLEDTSNLQVPGYKLVRRLGAGGYGEVWLAEAPGGLTKAVKIVFGYHNEKRAERELHSLEKIKTVRHPFLLSLERIEIVDNRLVIVTELADGSLKDRFVECRHNGLPGIPRDQLLGFLSDTADALDFLTGRHGLQHLDIKPENLLLVGNHVKVADFGLVKEIANRDLSLVGGLTPTYSAPEVFQGAPSVHSDQYSLAVLYQEMVSGGLPFPGISAAELTLQHVHDNPDLSSLPSGERYVVARALAKDPERRYANCSAFLKALLDVDTKCLTPISSPVAQTKNTPPDERSFGATEAAPLRPVSPTLFFDNDDDSALENSSLLLEVPVCQPSQAPAIPPLDLTEEGFRPAPVLVIGVGGTAGVVLQQFRSRLEKRLGNTGRIPGIQFLLIDTDKRALSKLTQEGEIQSFNPEETLALTLRKPQEYRDNSAHLFRWLSRRWLYNIPKSLLTEGLRPLGRLALIDNSRRTLQRIRLALSSAIDSESIPRTSEITGIPFRSNAVRVYLVASVSGGTGSGMSLDLGYWVRALLARMGVSETCISGLFLHSTGREQRYRDLAKVNAHAWLAEYNHFLRPDGFYPGDESSGLPPFEPGQMAFDHAYFVELGNALEESELTEAAESVAEMLYLETLTPAQQFFDQCRETTRAANSPAASLRTFGLHRSSTLSKQHLNLLADELSYRIILSWTGKANHVADGKHSVPASSPSSAANSDTNHLICGTMQLISQLQISVEGLAASTRNLVESQFGKQAEGVLRNLLQDLTSTGRGASLREVVELVNRMFEAPEGTPNQPGEFVLQRPLNSVIRPLVMKLSTAIEKWVLGRLNQPDERLEGAVRSVDWFAKHFERVILESRNLQQCLQQQLSQVVAEILSNPEAPTTELSPKELFARAVSYYRLKLDFSALRATQLLSDKFQSELKGTRESLVEFGRHLRNLAARNADENFSNSLGEFATSHESGGVARMLREQFAELARDVDERFQAEFVNSRGGLFEAMMGNNRAINELLATLKRLCVGSLETQGSRLTIRAPTRQAQPLSLPPRVAASPRRHNRICWRWEG